MKRGKTGPKRAKGSRRTTSAARKGARAAPRRRKAPAQAARKPARKPAARKAPAPRPKVNPRQKAAAVSRRSLVQAPEGELQLADPVEAAQEDLRALPEKALFDPDRSGRDDDLAEMLGEEYVRAVTSGEEQGVELRDQAVPEEEGGPFVESSGQKEFAHDEDDAEVEPLPTTRRPQTRILR